MRYYSEISEMLFTDHINHTIELETYPKRIISLVPSQSELLWDLGLKDQLVGITKFCIHPKELFHTVTRVGGTKTLNIEKIRSLNPDLIIGNKEENERLQIVTLQKEFKVWMSDIYTLDDALKTIDAIGEITNTVPKAREIFSTISRSFENLPATKKRVLYLIWKPYMAAGKATFIGDMISKIGLENAVEDVSARYPSFSIEEIRQLKPEVIFLSSEPFPFKEKHVHELQQELPDTKIILVDGELFSWYGSRLLKSVAYFHELSATLI
ncbi:MAG: helical backbone metal receptor [Bacteroidota bacterium]